MLVAEDREPAVLLMLVLVLPVAVEERSPGVGDVLEGRGASPVGKGGRDMEGGGTVGGDLAVKLCDDIRPGGLLAELYPFR